MKNSKKKNADFFFFFCLFDLTLKDRIRGLECLECHSCLQACMHAAQTLSYAFTIVHCRCMNCLHKRWQPGIQSLMWLKLKLCSWWKFYLRLIRVILTTTTTTQTYILKLIKISHSYRQTANKQWHSPNPSMNRNFSLAKVSEKFLTSCVRAMISLWSTTTGSAGSLPMVLSEVLLPMAAEGEALLLGLMSAYAAKWVGLPRDRFSSATRCKKIIKKYI